jgi:hypothetical protein
MADANLKGWSQAVTLTPASCAFIGPQPMSAASATPAAMAKAKAKPAGRQHGSTAIAHAMDIWHHRICRIPEDPCRQLPARSLG